MNPITEQKYPAPSPTDKEIAADKKLREGRNKITQQLIGEKEHTSRFQLSADKTTITFYPKKGDAITGRITQNANGYAVHLTSQFNLSNDKKLALERRMRSWYYYTHLQNK